MRQKLITALALIAAVSFGLWIARFWNNDDGHTTSTEATILLEHIKNVQKLVTTEGYFSEIYSEQDTKTYFFVPSTKKILIKVKAKVSAGFDLSQLKVEANQETKTLIIKGIPQPTIIAVEPNVSFYDVANGYFNSFSNEDFTRISKKAVDTIRSQAQNSPFMESVKQQGIKNFDAIRLLAESMGWKVQFESEGKLMQ